MKANVSVKKILLGGMLLMLSQNSIAQSPTYQEKVFYTCKVWGLVKYYHSEVSTCQVNWDSVLVATFPLVKNAVTYNDFNDALDSMLLAAGPMDIAITPPPPVLPIDQRRNLNFGWTNDTMLRADVQIILDTILNNYRPGPNCWVQNNTSSSGGWLYFPYDDTMYYDNTSINFPSEEQRALILCKYWNIINYFNPYNYVLDVPWDSTLYNGGLAMINATNTDSLFRAVDEMAASLNDAHVDGLTSCSYWNYGIYQPLIILKYAEGKYIAAKENVVGIAKGDEVTAINGITMSQWEDSLGPRISAGDSAVFRRIICDVVLRDSFMAPAVVETIDSMGVPHTLNLICGTPYSNAWFSYRENDTLYNKKWRLWDCNVGYVHMGNLLSTDVSTMYAALQSTDAIIFDIRNYPNGTAWPIANLMYAQSTQFAHDLEPDVTYPGTFFWYFDDLGYNNPNPYQGQVIVLVNEETQSQAEYSAMILEAMPNTIVVGSQTAGADGNVVYWNLSSDIRVGYTGLGIFYPNGDSTQRIGIVPDTIVERTQIGIRHGRDIVLEKAMQIAGCVNGMEGADSQFSSDVFPNPAFTQLTVSGTTTSNDPVVVEILDMTGKMIATNNIVPTGGFYTQKLEVDNLAAGIYLVRLTQGENVSSKKFIKE
jgi:carboxyl-terminal processing protease